MGKILTLLNYIIRVFRDPSTYAAVSAVTLSLGLQLPNEAINHWLTVLGLVSGALGIFIVPSSNNNTNS